MVELRLIYVYLLLWSTTLTGAKVRLLECAIQGILRTIPLQEQRKINLVCFGNTTCTNLADAISKRASENFSIEVFSIEGPKKSLRNGSSVILFDSAEQFREAAPGIKWLSHPAARYKLIVYAPSLKASDVIESIEDGFDIDQVAFLMNETKHSIDLVTSFMFTERACRKNQLKTINKFIGTTATWETNDFFPRKYKNMHNCRLSLRKTPMPDPKADFFPTIAKNLNFSLNITVGKAFFYYSNETDLVDYTMSMPLDYLSNYLVTTSYLMHKAVWILPSGEPFKQLEKMFMMFDDGVWTGIGCTLLVLLLLIKVIGRTSVTIRNFVFGRGVQTPTMNLLEIFLCGAQYKVPGRNFARFILLLFVFWSLVIRTCYQSKLFEFLQSDLRKPRIEFIEDAIQQNFTLSDDGGRNIFEQFEEAAETSNKLAVLTTEEKFIFFINWKYRSGSSSLHALSQVDVTKHFGTVFKLFSPFLEEFNVQVGRMAASGLFNYWYSDSKYAKRSKRYVDAIGPQVLTMDHMEVAFIASLLPLTLAITAFILEVTVHWMKTAVPRIRIYCVLKKYYELIWRP